MCRYVLITPAKNEELCIENTIKSVISQTLLPSQWVIVSDGSTDRTDEIIKNYQKSNSFIKYLRNESNQSIDFSSKVRAFNLGLSSIDLNDYCFIGNLDADVSFEANYYEEMIRLMNDDIKLGIVGGHICEFYNGSIKKYYKSDNSVSGAVQLFRRECFESIGGYIPIRIGGIDSAAEICARANGWKVKTYSDYRVIHYGQVLTGTKSKIKTMYKKGLSRYQLGYHALFHLLSCIGNAFKPPVVVGSTSMLFGYIVAAIKRKQRVLPNNIMAYLQKEQMSRIGIFKLKVGKKRKLQK